MANSTTARAAPRPQSRSWLIWLSMSMAIIMSPRPPSSAGVTKNPSAVTKTRRQPVASPDSDSGR